MRTGVSGVSTEDVVFFRELIRVDARSTGGVHSVAVGAFAFQLDVMVTSPLPLLV